MNDDLKLLLSSVAFITIFTPLTMFTIYTGAKYDFIIRGMILASYAILTGTLLGTYAAFLSTTRRKQNE